MKVFKTHDEFCEFVGEQLKKKDHIDTAFVIMKSGIDEGDLINAKWTIEIFEYINGDYEWLNDYYEGQQFFEVAAVLLTDEVVDIIMDHLFFHIMSNFYIPFLCLEEWENQETNQETIKEDKKNEL